MPALARPRSSGSLPDVRGGSTRSPPSSAFRVHTRPDSSPFPHHNRHNIGGAVKIRTVILGALAVLTASAAQAQQRRITGRVTGEGGASEPLAGASVTVVGT